MSRAPSVQAEGEEPRSSIVPHAKVCSKESGARWSSIVVHHQGVDRGSKAEVRRRGALS